MTDAAVFKGTFSDIRTVKGRKIVQLIIEVPQELGNSALQALGGLPDPANPVWVAVARIDPKAAEEPKALPAPEKERKKWEEMPAAQQAAIRCAQPDFWLFLVDYAGVEVPSEDAACRVLRELCGVQSRKELNEPSQAREAWVRIDNEYYAWQRGYR